MCHRHLQYTMEKLQTQVTGVWCQSFPRPIWWNHTKDLWRHPLVHQTARRQMLWLGYMKSWAKHNATLEEVLQWMEDFGITLNFHNCAIELKFYGYRFSENGLIPTLDKIRAIKECTEPKSKMAVWSFPGMTGYLAKFIPRYASLTKSLRDLTHKETKFHWGQDEREAFKKLKESISNEDTIAFFNSRVPTIVRTNTSYNEGLSAALFQKTGIGCQPVHFISHTLVDREKRYSQTENDTLYVKCAKDQFSI